MKLWDKGFSTDKKIDHFTVGNDRELDLHLAKYDVIASKAHAKMLGKIGLISPKETAELVKELDNIAARIEKGTFSIENSFEDMHSKIEYMLTLSLGDTGKKIHTARSRNDQVLVAMHLNLKDELTEIKAITKSLSNLLLVKAQE
ncbi:MAG TPA: argininosuccinate lyase, partial [Maribacter sp.]|nr:argininosuccinate lyase [Maribacter sp.]